MSFMFTTTFTALVLTAKLASATSHVHNVVVGGPGLLAYTPPYVVAKVGDVVRFDFRVMNHTATQSSFLKPCSPLAGGFDSGFQPVAADQAHNFPYKEFHVTNTAPAWFYCQQGTHCSKAGMVFAVNPGFEPAKNTFWAFQSIAKGGKPNDKGYYPDSNGNYPNDKGEYPKNGNYPNNNGDYPKNGDYPNEKGYYPNKNGDYPNNSGDYPKNGDYPNNSGDYPKDGNYPNDKGYYPDKNGNYPNNNGEYPKNGNYPNDKGYYPNKNGDYPNNNGEYPKGKSAGGAGYKSDGSGSAGSGSFQSLSSDGSGLDPVALNDLHEWTDKLVKYMPIVLGLLGGSTLILLILLIISIVTCVRSRKGRTYTPISH